MANITTFIKQIEAHRKRAEAFSKQIATSFKQVVNPISEMNRQMQEFTSSVKKMFGNQNYFKNLAEQTKAFLNKLEKSRELDYRAYAWLIENGWPPLIHVAINAPAKLMIHCVENKLDEKSVSKLLDIEIVNYHDSDIDLPHFFGPVFMRVFPSS